jgi:hypothetical protein
MRNLGPGLLTPVLLAAACCFVLTAQARAQNRGVYPLGMSATNSGVTPEPGFTYVNQLLNQRQTTARRGPGVTPEQAAARYKVNSLGFASSVNLPGKVKVGFKYFQEFSNRSTFQGHSIQISGAIKF